MNVENLFPYNEMTIESDTTLGACVRIPKIYVKNSVDENGLITREISKTKLEGYHCHPAFMQNGTERNGILIASNIVESEEVTFDEAQSAIYGIKGIKQTAKGNTYGTWENIIGNTNHEIHMYNIFEHHLITLLMLTEYETTNIKVAMGLAENAESGNYRGITQHWGDINLFCDGLEKATSSTTKISIFDNQGNFELIQTTKNTPGGYPITVSNESGENWNLGDIFIGEEASQNIEDGSYGSYQNASSIGDNQKIIVSDTNKQHNQTPFYIQSAPYITKAHYRLAKFTD